MCQCSGLSHIQVFPDVSCFIPSGKFCLVETGGLFTLTQDFQAERSQDGVITWPTLLNASTVNVGTGITVGKM